MDAADQPRQLDHRARHRRRLRHCPQPAEPRRADGGGDLCGDFPQHPAAGPAVPLVLRVSRSGSGRDRPLDQARSAAAGIHLMPAALATGLRPLQAFRLVLLPLGLRAIVGPLTSEFLITVKMSSISLTIGVLELTAQSRHIENYTFQGLEAFTVATVVYLLLGLAVTGLMRVIDSRIGGLKLQRAPS